MPTEYHGTLIFMTAICKCPQSSCHAMSTNFAGCKFKTRGLSGRAAMLGLFARKFRTFFSTQLAILYLHTCIKWPFCVLVYYHIQHISTMSSSTRTCTTRRQRSPSFLAFLVFEIQINWSWMLTRQQCTIILYLIYFNGRLYLKSLDRTSCIYGIIKGLKQPRFKIFISWMMLSAREVLLNLRSCCHLRAQSLKNVNTVQYCHRDKNSDRCLFKSLGICRGTARKWYFRGKKSAQKMTHEKI